MKEQLTEYEIKLINILIKAIRSRTLLCSMQVSASGMTRKLLFVAVDEGSIWRLNQLFLLDGYKLDRRGDVIVKGCGMDMVWNTVYTMAHKLNQLGFISADDLPNLSQNSATII